MAVTANSTPAPSRRAFFGSAVAAGALVGQIPALPAMVDAAVLAFAPRIEALASAAETLAFEQTRLETVAFEMVGPSPAPNTPECRAWFGRLHDAQEACGMNAASGKFRGALGDLHGALDDLAGVRATTLMGLSFKARLARDHDSEELADSVLDDLLAMPAAS